MRDLGAQQNRGRADRFPHHPRPPDHSRDELKPGVTFVGVGWGRRLVHHPARVTPEAAYGEVSVAAALKRGRGRRRGKRRGRVRGECESRREGMDGQ